jgi:broad specificity phosphatase PhoE
MGVQFTRGVFFYKNLSAFAALVRPVRGHFGYYISNVDMLKTRSIQTSAQIWFKSYQGCSFSFHRNRRFFSYKRSESQTNTGHAGSIMKWAGAIISVIALAKVVFNHKRPSDKKEKPVRNAHLSGYEELKGKGIPQSLLATLMYLPQNYQATLFMRHGERPDLPSSGPDNVLLTEHGKEVAQRLGGLLSIKEPGLLVTSPKGRCVETLTAIVQGSSWQAPSIKQDKLIAPSNPFITDLDKAILSFKKFGGPALFNKQITDVTPPEGMGSTADGVKKVLDAYVQKDNQQPHLLNIAVTHDAVLTVVVGYLCDLTFSSADWPEFLNGILLWKTPEGLNIVWRGRHRVLGPKELEAKGL